MASALNVIAKSMQLACDAMDVTVGVVDYLEAPDNGSSKEAAAAGLVLRTASLACGAIEVGAKMGSASNQTLSRIKTGEVIVRILDVPCRFINALDQNVQGNMSAVQVVESGVLAPMASMFRAGIEQKIYQESHYLDMTPQQRADGYRLVPIPGSDPEYPEYERRPLIESECKQYLEEANKALPPVAITEIALRTGIITRGVKTATQLYQALAARLAGVPAGGGAAAAGGVVGVFAPVAAAPADPFDLVARDDIPPELHGDGELARYTCPINLTPIRFPVGDPNGVHIYERSAILQHLVRNPTSPMTRLPLIPAMLIPKPALLALIEHRLGFHSNRLRAIAAAIPAVASTPALQAAADAENPHL